MVIYGPDPVLKNKWEVTTQRLLKGAVAMSESTNSKYNYVPDVLARDKVSGEAELVNVVNIPCGFELLSDPLGRGSDVTKPGTRTVRVTVISEVVDEAVAMDSSDSEVAANAKVMADGVVADVRPENSLGVGAMDTTSESEAADTMSVHDVSVVLPVAIMNPVRDVKLPDDCSKPSPFGSDGDHKDPIVLDGMSCVILSMIPLVTTVLGSQIDACTHVDICFHVLSPDIVSVVRVEISITEERALLAASAVSAVAVANVSHKVGIASVDGVVGSEVIVDEIDGRLLFDQCRISPTWCRLCIDPGMAHLKAPNSHKPPHKGRANTTH
jgi:hypothetical protein